MLAGGAVTAIIAAPGLASLPTTAASTDGDLRVAVLAERYQRASEAVIDLINEAERRHGPFAYQEPGHSGRYHACLAFRERCTEALARTRPTSIQGLLLKMRSAFYCDSLHEADLDCNEKILIPALRDLEHLAVGIRV